MSSSNTPDFQQAVFVSTAEEFRDFLEFPYKHYSGDKNWVPPLRIMQKHLLDTKKNPFYKHAEIALFLTYYNGKPAGRIAAIDNKAYNEYNGSKTGFFGFFECVDYQGSANLLFKVAQDWLKDRGLTTFIGPMSPGMLDEIGIQVDGFDHKPALMMPYSKPYYDKLIQGAGYQKAVDLYAYKVTKETVALARTEKADEIVRKRTPGLNVRRINLRRTKKEVEIIHHIFNEAWKKNWGFSRVSLDEFYDLAKGIKKIIDPDFAHIAEVDGKPVAFSIALPDLNQALQHLDGSLWPTGWMKLLYHKRKINQIRTALMGVLPEYQKRGIDILLHREAIKNGLGKGFVAAEMSWLLETNSNMISVAEKIGGYKEKVYRLYQK